jgi:hypothetical protein
MWVQEEHRPPAGNFLKEINMGIGVSLLLVAVGAVLAFAVDATVSGIDLVTVGWILMIVGGVGALLSLIFWIILGGFADGRHDTTLIERDRTVV